MNASRIVAFSVLILVALWMLSGQFGNDAKTNDAKMDVTEAQRPEEVSKKLQSVRFETSLSEEIASDILINGQTKSSKFVNIVPKISGQITEIFVDEGNPLLKGQVILKIETNDLQARVNKDRELVNQKNIEYNAAKELKAKGFGSNTKFALARAELESARANLKISEINLRNREIKAPFAGFLEKLDVEVGSYINTGQNIGQIVDLNPISVIGFVNEKDIRKIKKGGAGFVTVIKDKEVQGEIIYISAMAENTTRTFKIEISIDNPDLTIVDGLTTKLRIPTTSVKAHKISPAILGLDDIGNVGLKLLDGENKVKFYPVEIIKDEADFMYVSGIPDSSKIITVGQEFVIDGQEVKPQEERIE